MALKNTEADFSIEEFQCTLKYSTSSKAPGPDGFTILYYKTFSDILLPHLAAYANSISHESGLCSESLSAHITVIPKSGKDPTLCGSYRPISLLNCDTKRYAKVMANTVDCFPFCPCGLQLTKLVLYPIGRSETTLFAPCLWYIIFVDAPSPPSFSQMLWKHLIGWTGNISRQPSAILAFPVLKSLYAFY